VFTVPANTLAEDGDMVQFVAAATPGNLSNENATVSFAGSTVKSEANLIGEVFYQIWLVRRNSTTADVTVVQQDTGQVLDDSETQAEAIVVDWTTALDLEVSIVSDGSQNEVHYIAGWYMHGSASAALGIGGVGGVGGGIPTTTPATVGAQGPATVSVDANLRARIEDAKDRAAIAVGFWGSPGSGGGGGGGGHLGAAAVVSAGGTGGVVGAQTGPAGFGNGGTGNTGGDISVVAQHATGGGGGGAGGAGGGDLEVWCGGDLTIGSGSINTNGGDGGDGGRGGDSTNGSSYGTGGGGGGGGGGSGGTLLVVVNGSPTNVNGSTVTASGGAGGAGGAGGPGSGGLPPVSAFGATGATGRDGNDGFVILIGA
jgi:hypothetical protein